MDDKLILLTYQLINNYLKSQKLLSQLRRSLIKFIKLWLPVWFTKIFPLPPCTYKTLQIDKIQRKRNAIVYISSSSYFFRNNWLYCKNVVMFQGHTFLPTLFYLRLSTKKPFRYENYILCKGWGMIFGGING